MHRTAGPADRKASRVMGMWKIVGRGAVQIAGIPRGPNFYAGDTFHLFHVAGIARPICWL